MYIGGILSTHIEIRLKRKAVGRFRNQNGVANKLQNMCVVFWVLGNCSSECMGMLKFMVGDTTEYAACMCNAMCVHGSNSKSCKDKQAA